jgi:hypothetical protein
MVCRQGITSLDADCTFSGGWAKIAYLREHYRAAFLAAMLNNQPMGFYNSLTLVKDAQRHGLHFKPVDVRCSEWPCTLEEHGGELWVRLGFNYVKGFRKETAEAISAERICASFSSIDDLTRRVADISKRELNSLAELGALNFVGTESLAQVTQGVYAPNQLIELEEGPPCGIRLGISAKLADQCALGYILEAQRGNDLVDVGFFIYDRLPVDLADGTDQTVFVQRWIAGAVKILQPLIQIGKARLEAPPKAVQDAEFPLLTLCMSPVITAGTMSDVLRYQMSNT